MPQTRTPIFPHRRNRDGSFESICPGCFMTIAHAQNETELKSVETRHVCECSLLAERGMYYSQVRSDTQSAA